MKHKRNEVKIGSTTQYKRCENIFVQIAKRELLNFSLGNNILVNKITKIKTCLLDIEMKLVIV